MDCDLDNEKAVGKEEFGAEAEICGIKNGASAYGLLHVIYHDGRGV